MHRYYEPGYYWHRIKEDHEWQVVKLNRLHATAPVTVTFIGIAAGNMHGHLAIELLQGELVGPIPDPSVRKVIPLSKS